MSITNHTLRATLIAATLLSAGARAADLAADVGARLRDSGALQGYRVTVKAKSGTVWLEGRVADQRQLATAVGLAESCKGVERVVNRLTVESAAPVAGSGFGMPGSMRAFAGPAESGSVKPAQALVTDDRAPPVSKPTGFATLLSSWTTKPAPPAPRPSGELQPAAYHRSASRRGPPMGDTLALPAPADAGGLVDGQIVPGTIQYGEGGPVGGGHPAGGMPGGYGAGGPMPMGGTGVGMPPIPMRGDGPNMPNYAWPSYAAYPNYAALQYPTQYSPTAWPYIGPFYPYPQVPLGWRRVSLEWDDGWWWLDFDERHIHSHHR